MLRHCFFDRETNGQDQLNLLFRETQEKHKKQGPVYVVGPCF